VKNGRSLSLALSLILCVVASSALLTAMNRSAGAQGITRYVAPTGTDTGSCTNLNLPCRTVQYAVTQAASGDVIKVAAGTYQGINHLGGLAQVVYINKSVTIRGGYARPGYADPPDPQANPTTLDAQGQGRVIYITGDVAVTVEGLRITGGDAEGLDGPNPYYTAAGGGVYVITATATIRANQVFSNTAWWGGGVTIAGGGATLSGNSVTNNSGWGRGGGFFLYQSDTTFEGNLVSGNFGNDAGGFYLLEAQATLNDNVISGNSGATGGGLALWGSSEATLVDNTIESNGAGEGGGLYLAESSTATLLCNTIRDNFGGSNGGGLYLWSSRAVLMGNTIADNSAGDYGGGLHAYDSNVTVNGNTISGNTARYGGGVYLSGSLSAVLDHNAFLANTADDYGGGVYAACSDLSMSGNVIRTNTADFGGGLYLSTASSLLTNNIIADNQASVRGSGLSSQHFSRLVHTTIAGNHGGDGSGIYMQGGTLALTNTIFVSHTVGIYMWGGTASFEATLWGNGTDWAGYGTVVTGTINLWGESDFVDPDGGNYRIGPGSAALDVGVDAGVTTDIDLQPRPYLVPDLGADEYWPPGVLKRVFLPLVERNGP